MLDRPHRALTIMSTASGRPNRSAWNGDDPSRFMSMYMRRARPMSFSREYCGLSLATVTMSGEARTMPSTSVFMPRFLESSTNPRTISREFSPSPTSMASKARRILFLVASVGRLFESTSEASPVAWTSPLMKSMLEADSTLPSAPGVNRRRSPLSRIALASDSAISASDRWRMTGWLDSSATCWTVDGPSMLSIRRTRTGFLISAGMAMPSSAARLRTTASYLAMFPMSRASRRAITRPLPDKTEPSGIITGDPSSVLAESRSWAGFRVRAISCICALERTVPRSRGWMDWSYPAWSLVLRSSMSTTTHSPRT